MLYSDLMEKILPIWQPVGWSTHEIARKIANKYGVKTSHTGTLDPMAQGVVIILLDEERLKKYEYAKWQKTYEFEIVFGISTDTYDGLGLILDHKKRAAPGKEQLLLVLQDILGEYFQTVPIYSTLKVKGKHLHQHARAGTKVELPKIAGLIYSAALIELTNVSVSDLCDEILGKVAIIEGDFRQQEITDQWHLFKKSNLRETYIVAKIEVEVSKGLYVRSLAQDISRKLGTIGFANNIVRTKNGIYSKKEAKLVTDVLNS